MLPERTGCGVIVRLIRPSFHFHQDNVLASFLVLGPQFFPLSTLASYLSIAGGVYLFVYNGLTDRPGSLAPVLSESPIHRFLDYSGIVALLVLPWILFSTRMDQMYFFIQGVLTLMLASIVDFTPQPYERPPLGRNALRYAAFLAAAIVVVYGILRVYAAVTA